MVLLSINLLIKNYLPACNAFLVLQTVIDYDKDIKKKQPVSREHKELSYTLLNMPQQNPHNYSDNKINILHSWAIYYCYALQ